ncbi:MAG: hypothetical protein V1845_01850 [bacterium]
MTYSYRIKSSARRHSPKEEIKGIATLNLLVILVFFILLAVFLVENDNLIGKNYELRNFEKRLSEQQALIKKLEIREAEQNSLRNLEIAAKNLNLIVVDKTEYLGAIQDAVALSGRVTR